MVEFVRIGILTHELEVHLNNISDYRVSDILTFARQAHLDTVVTNQAELLMTGNGAACKLVEMKSSLVRKVWPVNSTSTTQLQRHRFARSLRWR